MNDFVVRLEKIKGMPIGEKKVQIIKATCREAICQDIMENQLFYKVTDIDGVKLLGYCAATQVPIFEDMDYETDPVTGDIYSVDDLERLEE